MEMRIASILMKFAVTAGDQSIELTQRFLLVYRSLNFANG